MDRRFELTISVWLPAHVPLPETFSEWVYRAFGVEPAGATPTQLERVVETRHPPAEDIVFRRRDHNERSFGRSLYQ